jgi:hypothetical protein
MGEKYSLDVIAASLHIADYLIIGFSKKERLDRASGTRRRNNDPLPITLGNGMVHYNKIASLFATYWSGGRILPDMRRDERRVILSSSSESSRSRHYLNAESSGRN